MFRGTPELFADVIRTHPGKSHELFSKLDAGQIAELFLWAREQFTSRRVQPGMVITGDLVEDKNDWLLGLLRNRRDLVAADALQTVASTISNVWLAPEAKQLRDEILTSQRPALSSLALREIFADPRRRSITTRAELTALILEELNDLQRDLQHDRALRTQVWHHQRRRNNWQNYVPMDEVEFSTWLCKQLRQRLQARVALLREVWVQPRLNRDPADEPDIVVITLTSGELIDIPVEVKCNWNKRVVEDLTDQLINRYLNGPLGSEGIYIVGYFHSDEWPDDDAKRRNPSRKCTRQELQDYLLTAAKTAPVGNRKAGTHLRYRSALDADDMDDWQ